MWKWRKDKTWLEASHGQLPRPRTRRGRRSRGGTWPGAPAPPRTPGQPRASRPCATPTRWGDIIDIVDIINIANIINTGCLYKLSRINLLFGPLKCSKSNFNPVHVFLHFNSFCLEVLKLILASKLSELVQFENRTANNQTAWKKSKNKAEIKTMLFPSFRTDVFGLGDVNWTAKLNFKGGLLSSILL